MKPMGDIDLDYKIVRDPLYGYIGLTKREVDLLDTIWLQRLRRIKQLAMTDLVYPSAVHTRFEHSLGVLHVADMMASQLKLCDHDREVARVAGLLHDIGHGPFSHVFETVLEVANDEQVDHEEITLKILDTDAIRSILISGEDIFEDVRSIFADQKSESVVRDIVSSSLDADKLDYLRRDSYHTGVMYGVFDFDRIVRMLYSEKQYTVVKEKGMDALESFRLARYLMHKQVYQHHVRAIADSMLVRAAELHFGYGNGLDRLCVSDSSFLTNFRDYDDFTFLQELSRSPSEDARELVRRLKERKLLKRCYEENMEKLDYRVRLKILRMDRSDLKKLEKSIAKGTDINPNFIIVYPNTIENPVYKNPDRYIDEDKTPILVDTKENGIQAFKEISPISGSSEKYVQKLFVFCLPEQVTNLRNVAEKAIKDLA